MFQKWSFLILAFLICLCMSGCQEDGNGHTPQKPLGWKSIHTPAKVVVDDYEGVSVAGREWYSSRLGANRGKIESGTCTVDLEGGSATVTVTGAFDYAGAWHSLIHRAAESDELDPQKLLGLLIKDEFQCRIAGVEINVVSGSGTLKVELKNFANSVVDVTYFTLNGGAETLTWSTSPDVPIKFLNWLIEGAGNVEINEVRLLISGPEGGYPLNHAIFLYSYAHLYQCYDASAGWMRDKAKDPVNYLAAVQTMGPFALATAIAADCNFVNTSDAVNIVQKLRDKLLLLPTNHGLLPHFLTDGSISPGTEYSSIDTVIALVPTIIACNYLDVDSSGLKTMLNTIDWDDLTGGGSHSIAMGYNVSGAQLHSKWDTWGAEAFFVNLAYGAATGTVAPLDLFSSTPTWDGSGFNDEMSALFCDMAITDVWGNDWITYRANAFTQQYNYFAGHDYELLGLYGLSACEVPQPWTASASEVYGAWGIGGHNGVANDGVTLVGYRIVAPHYAAMTAKEHPTESTTLFTWLMDNSFFTPLNNVESIGDDFGIVRNSIKGALNLSLQCLGVARTLYPDGQYMPYQIIDGDSYLNNGYQLVVQ